MTLPKVIVKLVYTLLKGIGMHFELGQKIIDKIRGKKTKKYLKNSYLKSFSQCGEDLIINFIFTNMFKQESINYLDIGAHHSSFLSNTKFFYDKGNNGVLIEPDPKLFSEIAQNRKKDVCLNYGISVTKDENADFYIMTVPALNTFSKEDAYEIEENDKGIKIQNIIKIPLENINSILEQYFSHGLDFLSLDVEGLDFEILKSIDFDKYRPKTICTETINYNVDRKKQEKQKEIMRFLNTKNYFVYADTFINTIFIDKNIW